MVILALEAISVGIFIVFLIRMGRLWLMEHQSKKRVLAFFDDFDHKPEFVQCCVFLAIVLMRFAIVTVRAATHPATRTVTHIAARCNTLQHSAKRCNTLQRAATRCNTLQRSSACSDVCSCLMIALMWFASITGRAAAHCNIHVDTHCSTLQHSKTHLTLKFLQRCVLLTIVLIMIVLILIFLILSMSTYRSSRYVS